MFLTGLIFDAQGQRMSPASAYGRNGTRHAYYVSASLQRGGKLPPDMIGRLPAKPFEGLILERLRAVSGMADSGWETLKALVRRVDVEAHGVRISLSGAMLLAGDPRVALSRLEARLIPGDALSPDKRVGRCCQSNANSSPLGAVRGGEAAA